MKNKDNINLIPVLLGGDLNCYNLARAFHEEYGVISHVFGRYAAGPVKHSRIIEFHEIARLDAPEVFLGAMKNFADNHDSDAALILLGCTDDYAAMVIEHKDKLERGYIVPYIGAPLMESLVRKADFYDICEKYSIPYPKTAILEAGFDESELTPAVMGFAYPIIIKPSHSAEYWKHPFDGMKKVYRAAGIDQAAEIARQIFGAGYRDKLILQDLIPGGDSRMHVLTAYSDKDGRVRMMCPGRVLLEEHTPRGLGNHAAIISETADSIGGVAQRLRHMLDDLGYRGFSNFDIKLDQRDGSHRVFEINLRQGRSNYYTAAAGVNLAALIVGDYIRNKPLEYREGIPGKLWRSIPSGVIKRYVDDDELRSLVKSLAPYAKSSLWYPFDLWLNPRRFAWVVIHMLRHWGKFKKYMD